MYSFQFKRKNERVKERKQKRNGKEMEQRKKRRKGKKKFSPCIQVYIKLKILFLAIQG